MDALADLTTSKGTVIGDGLMMALDAIEELRSEAPDTPAAALLLSDGHDTGSRVTPGQAAARAAALEIPVFTVVVGRVTEGEGPGADVGALESIATTSGGDTFTAETSDELTSIYTDLGSTLSVDLEVEPSHHPLRGRRDRAHRAGGTLARLPAALIGGPRVRCGERHLAGAWAGGRHPSRQG